MRIPLLWLAALALLVPPAPARELLREIIHPKTDRPAFRCLVPADWREEIDALGNLQLSNPRRSANFSLSLAHSSAPAAALDALAQVILSGAVVAPWDSREPAEISGHRGYKYCARLRPAGGAEVRAEVILVAADNDHIAACSMLLAERIAGEDETLARLVQAAVRLHPPAEQPPAP